MVIYVVLFDPQALFRHGKIGPYALWGEVGVGALANPLHFTVHYNLVAE